jgi:hypothetical protein
MRGLAKPSWHRAKSLPYSLHSYFGCSDDKIIRQSQNNEPLRAQPIISLPVVRDLLRRIMCGTVALHDQPPLHAYEIHDIPPDGHLPPELHLKTAIAESGPEQRFGAGGRDPLFMGKGDGVVVIWSMRHASTILPLLPLRAKDRALATLSFWEIREAIRFHIDGLREDGLVVRVSSK